MPRRRDVPKRKIIPDPRYGDRLVAKFTNVYIWDGKKSVSERVIYSAFDLLNERGGGEEPAAEKFLCHPTMAFITPL